MFLGGVMSMTTTAARVAPPAAAPAAPPMALYAAAAPATPGMAPELGATVPGEETPPAPELGREKRESIDYSRRLGMLLASKKK